jgi:hypothetical protein
MNGISLLGNIRLSGRSSRVGIAFIAANVRCEVVVVLPGASNMLSRLQKCTI